MLFRSFPSHDMRGVLISERERCERLYHDNPEDWDKRKYLNRLRKQRQWTESKATMVAEKEYYRDWERKREVKSDSTTTSIYSPIYITTTIPTHKLRYGTASDTTVFNQTTLYPAPQGRAAKSV